MTEGPSDLLSRAADLIRDVAGNDLTPPPWHVRVTPSRENSDDDTVWVACQVGSTVAVVGEAYTSAPQDAKWIALLNPAVAPALERALRHEAGMIRTICERGDPFYGPSPLLDLARVILGEEEQ